MRISRNTMIAVPERFRSTRAFMFDPLIGEELPYKLPTAIAITMSLNKRFPPQKFIIKDGLTRVNDGDQVVGLLDYFQYTNPWNKVMYV